MNKNSTPSGSPIRLGDLQSSDSFSVPSRSGSGMPANAFVCSILIGDSQAAGFYTGAFGASVGADAGLLDHAGNVLEPPVSGVAGEYWDKWDSTFASFDDVVSGHAPAPIVPGLGIVNTVGAGGIGPEFSFGSIQASIYMAQGVRHLVIKVAANGASAGPAPGDSPVVGEWDPTLTGGNLYPGLKTHVQGFVEWCQTEGYTPFCDGVWISLGGNDTLSREKASAFDFNLERLRSALREDFGIDPRRIFHMVPPSFLTESTAAPDASLVGGIRGPLLAENRGQTSIDYSDLPVQDDFIHLQAEGVYEMGIRMARLSASRSGKAVRLN